MRIKARITFHQKPLEARNILNPLGFKEDKNDTLQVAEIYTDSIKYSSLIETLQKKGIKYNEYKTIVYSQKELDNTELLVMAPYYYCGYPEPDEDDGTYEDYSYDKESACPNCSQGLVQNDFLRVKKLKMGKKKISSLHWIYEFVITAELKNIIEDNNLLGCEFWPLIDHKKDVEYQGFYQLKITGEMPLMSSKAAIVPASGVKACECGKRGFTLKGQAIYNRTDIKEIKDFNKTHEWLGGGMSTWQKVIVTHRVYEVFKNEKIKGVQFYPVIVE